MKRPIFVMSLFLFVLAPIASRADIVIGNLGAPVLDGATLSPTQQIAAFFTMGPQPYSLTDLQVTMAGFPQPQTSFQLRSDAAGAPSTTVLTQFLNPTFQSGSLTYTFAPQTPLSLDPNTGYWLVGSTSAASSNTQWSSASNLFSPRGAGATFNTYAISSNGGTAWSNTDLAVPQFAVNGVVEPVLEPASLALSCILAVLIIGMHKWKRFRTAGFVLALFMLMPSATRADLIIGNLGNTGDGNPVVINSNSQVAAFFTMGSQDYLLTDLKVRLTGGVPDGITYQLRPDVGGNPAAFSTLTFVPGDISSLATETFTFTPPSLFTLSAGSSYWLVGSTTSSSARWVDSMPLTLPMGAGANFGGYKETSDGGSSWNTTGSAPIFQLNGATAAVPEPSSLVLTGITATVATVVGFCRHRITKRTT